MSSLLSDESDGLSDKRFTYVIQILAAVSLLTGFLGSTAKACEGTCEGFFQACMQYETPNTGCQAELDRCLRSCKGGKGSSLPLAPARLWGFMIYDIPTGRYGRSYGYTNGMEAEGLRVPPVFELAANSAIGRSPPGMVAWPSHRDLAASGVWRIRKVVVQRL